MKLQVAIDTLTISQGMDLLSEIQSEIDIVEVGTPLLLDLGMRPLQVFREQFPGLVFLADTKIMDAGFLEGNNGFKKGADIVTVLGAANNETVKGVLEAAKEYGGKVMADLIGVQDIAGRGLKLAEMGVDYICVHTSIDLTRKGATPHEEIALLSGILPSGRLAAAGGINLDTIAEISRFNPEIVIVGGGITGAQDAKHAAQEFKRRMRGNEVEC